MEEDLTFTPDYEAPEKDQELKPPLPEAIYITTETARKPPSVTNLEYLKTTIHLKPTEDDIIINPPKEIINNIKIKDNNLMFDNIVLIDLTDLKHQVLKTPNLFTCFKLVWCQNCQEYCYNFRLHKKTSSHKEIMAQLVLFKNKKPMKTDQNCRIIDVLVQANDVQNITNGTRKIVYINAPNQVTSDVHFMNTTSRELKILSCCGVNKDKGIIFFTGGKELGDYMLYEHEETIPPNEVSKLKIWITSENQCASSDLVLEIIIFDPSNNSTERITQTLTIYRNYHGTFYNGYVTIRDSQIWNKNVKFDDEHVNSDNPFGTSKTSLLTKGWNTLYKYLEFTLQQNEIHGTKIDLPQNAREVLEVISQETSNANFATKMVHLTLCELSHHFENQYTCKGKATTIVRHHDKEEISVDIKNVTSALLYLKPGDRALLMIQDYLILPAIVEVTDSEEIVVTIKDCNIIQEDDEIHISPSKRIQPFTIQLSCLEQLMSETKYIEAAGKYFAPTDFTPPTPVETCETYEFNNLLLDEKQKEIVIKTLEATPGPPQIVVGPPGTGKTTTLLEYVCQEVKKKKKVLLVCPTNQAVCSLQNKLMNLDFIKSKKVKVTKFSTPSMKVFQSCFTHCSSVLTEGNTRHTFPKNQDILESDIVLSTLTSSNRLGCLKNQKNLCWKEFDVIVYDEGAFCTEGSILIPLTTQIVHGNIRVKVVIFGDPQQIKQVPRSRTAKLAPDEDIMTRLLKNPVYLANPNLHHQLSVNYRNSKIITRTLKSLVYGESMTSQVDYEGEILFYHCESSFSDIQGNSKNSLPEAKKCFEVFQERKRDNVIPLILTYYSAQCHVVLAEAKHQKFQGFHQIKCMTAESIQGNESDEVIITMTLPAGNNSWQNDVNRSNVLISRARVRVHIVADLFKVADSTTFRRVLHEAIGKNKIKTTPVILRKLKKKMSRHFYIEDQD